MPTRTILKALIHQYFDLMDRVKELTAETSEHWQDLVAEVEAERKAGQERAEQAVPHPGAASSAGASETHASAGDPYADDLPAPEEESQDQSEREYPPQG